MLSSHFPDKLAHSFLAACGVWSESQPRCRAEHWGPERGLSSRVELIKLKHPLGKGEAEQDWGGGEAAGIHEPGFCQSIGGTNPMGRADLAGSWEKDPTTLCEPCLGTALPEPQTQLQQPGLSCGCSVTLQI